MVAMNTSRIHQVFSSKPQQTLNGLSAVRGRTASQRSYVEYSLDIRPENGGGFSAGS